MNRLERREEGLCPSVCISDWSCRRFWSFRTSSKAHKHTQTQPQPRTLSPEMIGKEKGVTSAGEKGMAFSSITYETTEEGKKAKKNRLLLLYCLSLANIPHVHTHTHWHTQAWQGMVCCGRAELCDKRWVSRHRKRTTVCRRFGKRGRTVVVGCLVEKTVKNK